ncbi:SIR2 family protein [Kineobactrum salinum]|uniref:Uncharacterized protein n=1 Tax=Kineobactrum salinum TaxID=2708301 RepID=A0A6C0U0F7_9GAMM|nr:SIR2 family protein [Kineobactrum salinum]QIB65580.1 hypothetical protein G3T16_09350 [Kineobactrum salinum]
MPVFVTDGPDIPEHLLQAQEEGRLVFFCGPGVAVPAGLPDTRGLINKLYRTLDTTRTPVEQQAFRNRQFDAVLELLERRHPGQRHAVREALAAVLKPRWRKRGATDTHRALLQLATDREGTTRLVTSNVDHVFRRVIARDKLAVPELVAPQLPLPRPDRWHGLVYLHGLLEQQETQFNRLVLSSGDFGLAYLGERWAARFVSELLRHFTVCFIGYELHDPLLRYLMDALAADEAPAAQRSGAWVLASYREGTRERVELEWQSRGFAPLLYPLPRGRRRHEALYGTLQAWAASYRDGVRSRRMVIAQHAVAPPLTASRADHAVGRVLWALGDGEAARHFADLNPVPPLAWLEPLSAALFEARDLPGRGPGSRLTTRVRSVSACCTVPRRPRWVPG